MERQENTMERIMGAVPILGTAWNLGKAIFGKSQVAQQRELMQEQEQSAIRLAEHNKRLAMDMWNDTNAEVQRKHYEDAGLSVGMMYKGSGAGGQTMGMGMGMPSTVGAPSENERMGLGLQASQQMANIELTKAQTENVKADTTKKAGADTDLAKAETDFKNILTKYQTESLEDQLEIIAQQKYTTIDNAGIIQNERQISDETTRAKINTINQIATNTALEAIALKQGIALDKAKIAEISASIQQRWKELTINETKSRYEHGDRIKAIEEYTKNALQVAGINAAGQVVGDVVRIATKTPSPKATHRVNEYPDGTNSTTYFK